MAFLSAFSDAAPTASRGGRYPVLHHVAVLFPFFAIMGGILIWCGGEEEIVRAFTAMRQRYSLAARGIAWLSTYGNTPFYLAYGIILLRSGWLPNRSGRRFVIYYLIFLVLLLLVIDTLKIWVGRPRPGEAGEYIILSLRKMQHSFPSNHMTETTFSLLSLALYCRNGGMTFACSAGIAVMGMTRLFLGRHHPTDLLGSLMLGSLAVYLLWQQTKPDAAASPPDMLPPPTQS